MLVAPNEYMPTVNFRMFRDDLPGGYQPHITITHAPPNLVVARDILQIHRDNSRAEFLGGMCVDEFGIERQIVESDLVGLFEPDDPAQVDFLMEYLAAGFNPGAERTKLILCAMNDAEPFAVLNMHFGDLTYARNQDIPEVERTASAKLHALHIDDDCRKMHVGSHLLAYALSIVARHYAYDAEVHLDVVATNDSARIFYDNIGITPSGHTRMAQLPSGVRVLFENRKAPIGTIIERLGELGLVFQSRLTDISVEFATY